MASTPRATTSEALLPSAGSYADLPPLEKREFEKRILRNPYALNISEMRALFEQGFPFATFDHTWISRYLELVDFHAIHQHFDVKTPPLSIWTNRQRSIRYHGKMMLGRERALNRLGFLWDLNASRWDQHYNAYKAYVESNASSDLNLTTARWANKQRSRRNQGRLPLQREQALERIGFAWNIKEAMWQKKYQDYRAYQKNPQSFPVNARVGIRSWLTIMRKKWDQLTPRQQQLLQEAGLVRQPFAQKAQEQWEQLEAVFAQQGHLRGLGKTSMILKRFASRLWHRYQTGKLEPEEQKRCDRIRLKEFIPNRAVLWSSFYNRAAIYIQQCGTTIQPVWKWPDRELSRWMGQQTGHWAQLSHEKRRLLQKLQIKTQEQQQQALWEQRYAQALALHARLGPYRERVYQDEDESLKRWIRRQAHHWDQLSQAQRKRLEALGLGKRMRQQQVPWEQRFAQALALYARLGPYQRRIYQDTDKSLEAWIRRQAYNWDQLSQAQREQLKSIGLEFKQLRKSV